MGQGTAHTPTLGLMARRQHINPELQTASLAKPARWVSGQSRANIQIPHSQQEHHCMSLRESISLKHTSPSLCSQQ